MKAAYVCSIDEGVPMVTDAEGVKADMSRRSRSSSEHAEGVVCQQCVTPHTEDWGVTSRPEFERPRDSGERVEKSTGQTEGAAEVSEESTFSRSCLFRGLLSGCRSGA